MPLLPRPLRCDRRRMKGRFVHRNIVTRAMRAELVGELAELGTPIAVNERACCCPAKPMVTVVMQPNARRPYPVDLLLCGHHYRVSQAALRRRRRRRLRRDWRTDHGRYQRLPAFPLPASCGSAASVSGKSFIPNGLVVPAPGGE